MPRLKIIIWSAATAAVLAFLAALFGRVSFGVILLRTLFWAVVFGVFSFGVQLFLEKMVPELFEAVSDSSEDLEQVVEAEPAENDDMGNNLNIVLEDEVTSGVEEIHSAEDAAEDEDENEFIEEIQAVDDDEVEAEEVAANDSNTEQVNREEPGEDVREIGKVSDVDSLPDLDAFSDSFDSVAASQERSDEFTTQRSEDVDLLGSHHDPATVAKAVRTIIGRDQEG